MGGVAQKVAESFGDAIRTEIGRQSASVEAPGLYYLTR